MPGSQKPRAKCECHEVIKDLGPGMIQKFIKHRPTCTYKTKTDRAIKRLKRKADIWEQPLALWCVIRNKMLQAAFAAPNTNALVEVYLEKQSATVRKIIGKLKLNDIHSGKLSDQMQQHWDNVVKIVIHSMSKYEMQLILITSIWRSKVNRAVQLHILALFLAFMGDDLSDYPYLETVVGADSLPTDDPTDLSEKLLRALFETPRRKQQKSREEQSNGRVENLHMPWFGKKKPQPAQTATPLIHNQHQQQPHQQGHTPYMAHQHQGQHQPQHTPTHQHQHQHALLPQTSNHASTTTTSSHKLRSNVQHQLVRFGILCDQDYHPETVLSTVVDRFTTTVGGGRFCTYDGIVNQQSRAPLVRVFKAAFNKATPDCQVVSATLVFQNASWRLDLLDQLGSKRYKCVHIVITVHPGGSAPAWGHIAALVITDQNSVPGHKAGTIYTYDPQKGSAYPKAHHKGGTYGSFYELLQSRDVESPRALNPDDWNWPDPHGLVGTGLQEWLEIGQGGTRVHANPNEAGPPWWCKAESVSCNTTCPQVDRGGLCVTLVVLMTVLCSTLGVWNMPLVSQTAQQVLEAYLNLQSDKQNMAGNPARAILRRRIFHWVLDRYHGDLAWSAKQACIPRQ